MRVERLLKRRAVVVPARLFWRECGVEPVLMASLWEWAVRISVVRSVAERSAVERR